MVLRKWYEVREQVLDLLGTANPNCIPACELNLALLKPENLQSRAVIERYRGRYSSAIKTITNPVNEALEAVNQEIDRLLRIVEKGEASADRQCSPLLDLCGTLANQLSGLKRLEAIGGGHE